MQIDRIAFNVSLNSTIQEYRVITLENFSRLTRYMALFRGSTR
jgi:hypothetical protein